MFDPSDEEEELIFYPMQPGSMSDWEDDEDQSEPLFTEADFPGCYNKFYILDILNFVILLNVGRYFTLAFKECQLAIYNLLGNKPNIIFHWQIMTICFASYVVFVCSIWIYCQLTFYTIFRYKFFILVFRCIRYISVPF